MITVFTSFLDTILRVTNEFIPAMSNCTALYCLVTMHGSVIQLCDTYLINTAGPIGRVPQDVNLLLQPLLQEPGHRGYYCRGVILLRKVLLLLPGHRGGLLQQVVRELQAHPGHSKYMSIMS